MTSKKKEEIFPMKSQPEALLVRLSTDILVNQKVLFYLTDTAVKPEPCSIHGKGSSNAKLSSADVDLNVYHARIDL